MQDPDYLKRQAAVSQEADLQDAPEISASVRQEENLQDASAGTVSPFTGLTYYHNEEHAAGNYEIQNGIDVSKWDGNIDWAAVKKGGVQFAIIRASHRNTGDGQIVDDEKMSANMDGCDAQGIPYGAYIFSQAITRAEAVEEADRILGLISGRNVTLPVVMDYEIADAGVGRLADADLSKAEATEIAEAFCERIRSAGYQPMVYTDKDRLTEGIDGTALAENDGCPIWLANWNTRTSYQGPYDYWQYGYSSNVPGVSTDCDCDFRYIRTTADRTASFSGKSRYDTMQLIMDAAISENLFASGGTVGVASGADFPDALAASGFCGLAEAPLILTDPAGLSSQAESVIAKLNPSSIVLFGGEGAVSLNTEASLRNEFPGAKVTRISGDDRYRTADAIFENGKGWSNQAIIVNGENSADALSAAPYAYAAKCPIFLADAQNGLDAETRKAIRDGGFSSVLIAGGTGAVPAAVETQLREDTEGLPVLRFAGSSRYETCELIAEWAMGLTSDTVRPLVQMNAGNPSVATGNGFADALAGAAFCGRQSSVLLLADDLDGGMACISGTLAENASSVNKVSILGGTAAVAENVRKEIRIILG